MSNKLKNMIQENQKRNNLRSICVKLESERLNINKENNNNNKTKKYNKMKNKSIAFMAVGNARKSAEPVEFKLYEGIASCGIVAINPNKAQLEKITGKTLDKEPEYIKEVEKDGTTYKTARIDILFKLAKSEKGKDLYFDADGEPVNNIFHKSILITKRNQTNREGTKTNVIDAYCNTAWVTDDLLANNDIPIYSNGPASIMKNYRPLMQGEEVLTKLMKVFLNITPCRIEDQTVKTYDWKTKSYINVEHPEDCECRFDNIDEFFKGNFKEIQDWLAYAPTNKVQVLFGVRTTEDGKTYQDIYDTVLANGNNNAAKKFEDLVGQAKENGGYKNTEFKFCNFRQYSVEATNFTQNNNASNPFESANDDLF